MRPILATVEGDDTSGFPEVGILWKCGQVFLATTVFLGGRWMLTVKHAVADGTAGDYHVTIPAVTVGDMRPSNSFRVVEVIPAPNDADLALLRLASGTLAPGGDPTVFATEEEFQQAGQVRFCGFGSQDCSNPSLIGVKRISIPLKVVADPAAKQLQVNSATEFAADNAANHPITCPSDSGGAAFVTVDGVAKLAGAIIGTILDPQNNTYTKAIHLSVFLPWLRQETGFPI